MNKLADTQIIIPEFKLKEQHSLRLLSQGELSYQGESNREYQAQYWITQAGQDVVAICSPLDSQGNGLRDHNVLLNRDEYRLVVAQHLRNIHGDAHPPLTIFALCVHQGSRKGVYGLAFKMEQVGEFDKRAHIDETQMTALLGLLI